MTELARHGAEAVVVGGVLGLAVVDEDGGRVVAGVATGCPVVRLCSNGKVVAVGMEDGSLGLVAWAQGKRKADPAVVKVTGWTANRDLPVECLECEGSGELFFAARGGSIFVVKGSSGAILSEISDNTNNPFLYPVSLSVRRGLGGETVFLRALSDGTLDLYAWRAGKEEKVLTMQVENQLLGCELSANALYGFVLTTSSSSKQPQEVKIERRALMPVTELPKGIDDPAISSLDLFLAVQEWATPEARPGLEAQLRAELSAAGGNLQAQKRARVLADACSLKDLVSEIDQGLASAFASAAIAAAKAPPDHLDRLAALVLPATTTTTTTTTNVNKRQRTEKAEKRAPPPSFIFFCPSCDAQLPPASLVQGVTACPECGCSAVFCPLSLHPITPVWGQEEAEAKKRLGHCPICTRIYKIAHFKHHPAHDQRCHFCSEKII